VDATLRGGILDELRRALGLKWGQTHEINDNGLEFVQEADPRPLLGDFMVSVPMPSGLVDISTTARLSPAAVIPATTHELSFPQAVARPT